VIRVADVPLEALESLLARYNLNLKLQPVNEAITGSFWGDSEAGVRGHSVFVRSDTPVHSTSRNLPYHLYDR